MERVGFYLAVDTPVERLLPQIARKVLGDGDRLLVVAADAGLRQRIGEALWDDYPEDFLAHGEAGEGHADRHPILLSESCEAANGARLVALADGQWRDEAEAFDRALLFFDEAGRGAARGVWSRFDGREEIVREFHEHDGSRWQKRR